MAWIRRYILKNLIVKLSVDFNCTFSSFAWLCVFPRSCRLLCWIKAKTFCWNCTPISYWNDFIQITFGKCAYWRRAMNICKKFKLWKFWKRPLWRHMGYAFILILVNKNECKNCPNFTLKWLMLNFFREMCLLEEICKLFKN